MTKYNYESSDELISDWYKLRSEYQEKLFQYIKKMVQIQRLESRMDIEIREQENKLNISHKDYAIRCNFCHRSQNEVEKIIASDDGSYICNECVEACMEILKEELDDALN